MTPGIVGLACVLLGLLLGLSSLIRRHVRILRKTSYTGRGRPFIVLRVGRRRSSPLTRATAPRATSRFWLAIMLIVTLRQGANVTAMRPPLANGECTRERVWQRCEPSWRERIGAVAIGSARHCPSRSSVRSNRVAGSGSSCCAAWRSARRMELDLHGSQPVEACEIDEIDMIERARKHSAHRAAYVLVH
jgi:hypothetical protein